MLDTLPLLQQTDFPEISRSAFDTAQVNLGYLCNQSCVHCHVNAGPTRKELMDKETIDLLLEVLRKHKPSTLDLTGGAPEMNPHFRYLVAHARALGIEVIDRCNLTILLEPGYEDLAEFLAEHEVIVTASLPCYTEENVQQQRGKGVFARSIESLQKLNALGYGHRENLDLNLVYNPTGAQLPPSQEQLKQDYQNKLAEDFGIVFNELYTITNMPIARFGNILSAKGQFEAYMRLLKDNYAEENLESLMCRSMLSVDWEGYLYDCDFNQMLGMPLAGHLRVSQANEGRPHLREMLDGAARREINIADHCYGCTAGQGSSCGGALA